LPRAFRAFAVLAALAVFLAGSRAGAASLTVGSSITTSVGGFRFAMPAAGDCTGYACTAPNVGQMAVPNGQSGIDIGGVNGAMLQSISPPSIGYVDTFLEFTVSSTIASAAGLSIVIMGCGGNPGASKCGASTAASASTVDIQTFADASLTQLLGSTSLGFSYLNPNASSATGSQSFAPLSKFYMTVDIKSYTALNSGTAGYADMNQVILMVSIPEPAGAAVLAFALAGLGTLRRRSPHRA